MKKLIFIVAVIFVIVSLCSCGNTAKPLADVFDKIKSEVGISDMVEFTSASDLNRFYGIDEKDISDFAGGINNSGVNQEEIVMVRASDKDAVTRIEGALNNRYKSKLNETRSYNPDQYAVIEKCKVDINDLYITMFISENASSMNDIFSKAIGQ